MKKIDALKFKSFQVYMTYGFAIDPPDNFDETIKKLQKANHQIRDGWNTIYKLNFGQNDLVQNIALDDIDRFSIDTSSSDNPHRWKSGNARLSGSINRHLSIRRDGLGTITLCFNVTSEDHEVACCTSDVLKILMMIPRTQYGNDNGELVRPDLEINRPEDILITKKDWNQLSYPYKLFIETLCTELPKKKLPEWSPMIDVDDSELSQIRDFIQSNNDSQIPYVFVRAETNYHMYKSAFLERSILGIKKLQRNRRRYNKEISSILGRWLNSNNIPYASAEYWESKGNTKDYCYQSKFMNSLVFTTYSGMVTLSIYPELSGDRHNDKIKELLKKPIEITKETILRQIEFSRLRWHHAVVINYRLDGLINEIYENQNPSDIHRVLESLVNLEEKIAIHMENPFHNLWDASLGSSLTEFFNQNILNSIEDELSNKLNHTRNLLNDKLKLLSIKEFLTEI